MSSSGRLPNSPAVVAVLALGVWCAFVAARLFRLADGDIGYFVVAGTEFTDASSGLPLVDGPGYDGQFFHRLASDPLNSDDRVAGTVLDSSWRAARVGYPLLAWLVSGVGFSTSAALVVVNLIAITVLGYLGGRSARSAGRHAIWGLLLPMYFGFAFSIARNLAEVVATTALVAGVMLATQHRAVPAALCLSFAVLSRETRPDSLIVSSNARVQWAVISGPSSGMNSSTSLLLAS